MTSQDLVQYSDGAIIWSPVLARVASNFPLARSVSRFATRVIASNIEIKRIQGALELQRRDRDLAQMELVLRAEVLAAALRKERAAAEGYTFVYTDIQKSMAAARTHGMNLTLPAVEREIYLDYYRLLISDYRMTLRQQSADRLAATEVLQIDSTVRTIESILRNR